MENLVQVPGYSRYYVTPAGDIVDMRFGRVLGGPHGQGYRHANLWHDDGYKVRWSRHRFVATAYHGPAPFEKAVVNHIDGIPGNDAPSNLEWTTYRGNQEHAGLLGLTERCIPVSSRDVFTGVVTHYPSAKAAGEALGLTKFAILWRLSQSEERVYPEGLQYRKRDDSRDWYAPTTEQYGRKRSVLVKDILNGTELRFEQQNDVAALLEVSLATVSTWLNHRNQPLVSGRFLLKYEDDKTPWREISDPRNEDKRRRSVVVTNAETGEERVFDSALLCALAMGLKTTTLNERLNKGPEKIHSDGFKYRRY